MSWSRRCVLALIVLAMLCSAPGIALGSGFAILEQSGRGLGQAFAGATAGTEDASCVFFNPACMSELDVPALALAAHVIMPTFEFDNEGSAYPRAGGMPVTGGDGGNGGDTAFVPSACYSHGLSEDFRVGLAITAPFGLVTEYDAGWVGRYQGIRTDLETLDINPAVSWKISDRLALGAGLSAQYAAAELTGAVDFGGILAAQGVPGAVPQGLDGHASVEGDDWGVGYNLGLLLKPSEPTQVGLAYRSRICHTLEGDADFTVPPAAAALTAMGLFVDTDAEAEVELPESVSLGLSQRLGESWTLLFDLAWTRWSRFEELRIKYASGQPDSVTEEAWEDTWRCAVGVNYAWSDRLTLRAGAAYDETPIPDAEHRTPRIPDGDRTWLALGAGYAVSDDLVLDAGLVHLFFNDTDMDHVGPTGDRLAGTYEGSVDIASLQLSWKL